MAPGTLARANTRAAPRGRRTACPTPAARRPASLPLSSRGIHVRELGARPLQNLALVGLQPGFDVCLVLFRRFTFFYE